jgi:hypothetical protein
MKKIVLSAVSFMFILQVFAVEPKKILDGQSKQLSAATASASFAAELPKGFDKQAEKLSKEIAEKLSYARAQNNGQWRKSIVFINVEVSQQEVVFEGGGPRYLVDDKTAVATYGTVHKHTCLGAFAEPGIIIAARGCFYTVMERNSRMPTKLTVIEENSDFPNPSPIKINKATATLRSHDGAVIMSKDISDLILHYKEEGLLSWETDAALPKFTLPKSSETPALWQNAVFIAYNDGINYDVSKIKKKDASGSYVLLNIRGQKTAGDLVISGDGKYLLGINRRGHGTPALDFGVTAIRRPEIITTIHGRRI